MEELKNNLHLLRSIRNFVEAKNETYYSHIIINKKEITEKTISIVMTSHERSKQTYFTLETINRCYFKDIQVILVDDSITDIIKEEELKKFNIHIELISINQATKYWSNPCVNYNIGFQYIMGGKVVIQNGEVCYVGDVLSYINDKVIDNCYYVFDVKASTSFETNETIYSKDRLNKYIYDDNLCNMWYQHSQHRNAYFHFLTGMNRKTFDLIGGFSYDYSFGSCFDDDDLVLKIKNKGIVLVNVKNEIEHIGGIHLYHGYEVNIKNKNAYKKPANQDIFLKKINLINKLGNYLEISDYSDLNDVIKMYNKLNSY